MKHQISRRAHSIYASAMHCALYYYMYTLYNSPSPFNKAAARSTRYDDWPPKIRACNHTPRAVLNDARGQFTQLNISPTAILQPPQKPTVQLLTPRDADACTAARIRPTNHPQSPSPSALFKQRHTARTHALKHTHTHSAHSHPLTCYLWDALSHVLDAMRVGCTDASSRVVHCTRRTTTAHSERLTS